MFQSEAAKRQRAYFILVMSRLRTAYANRVIVPVRGGVLSYSLYERLMRSVIAEYDQ